jgi:CMP/dCMP kinase
MIITISGKPGSGKSSIAKMLALNYKLKHYSTGDYFRQRAKEKNLTFKEYTDLALKEKHHDNETDKWQEEIGKKEDNFIIDGRLSHKFILNAIKIYLDVNREVGAERIMKEKREEEIMLDFKHAIELWEHRVNSEHERYTNYYNTDIHDLTQYDFVIDTSNLSKKEVFEKIVLFVDSRKSLK